MALTPSTMLPLGTPAPDFALPDTDGQTVKLADFAGKSALLVIFMCNHCPYVVHIADHLAELGKEYQARNVGIVGINANDAVRYPEDSPAKMKDEMVKRGYSFPYLFDESQSVARAYRAACTPDFFLFDRQGRLVYRGQYDDSRPRSGVAVTGRDLRAALDAVLAGKQPSETQQPSSGCGIKWKA